MKINGRINEKITNKLIWVFIFAYIFIFCYLCFLKFQSFSYYDWDFASDVVVLWNSLHGKLAYYPFLEQAIFGAHLYLVIFLLMPVYALFQHPLTLLFLQSLFLGLAAYPLYLLARLKLNRTFALAVSIAYLLYPSLGYINIFEAHFEIYSIFFLFFALYYFEKEHFRNFLIFIFLAMLCKENVSTVVFMLGVYAQLRKRAKKWILVPSLLGIAWFLLAVRFIIPFFAKDAKLYSDGFIFSIYYKHLGSNLADVIKSIFMHPLKAVQYVFMPQKIIYIFYLLLPTAFLVFLSPGPLLMLIPILMQNLLSSIAAHSTINYHYVTLLIPFIFFSLIHALSKILRYKFIAEHLAAFTVFFLGSSILAGIYLGAPQLHLARYIKDYRIDDFAKEKEKLLKTIPKDASVIATFQFLPKLANRHHIYSMHFVSSGYRMYTKIKYEPPPNLEYALINFNDPLMVDYFFPPEAPTNIRAFIENGNWNVAKAADEVVLFKKDYPEGRKLFEIVKNQKIDKVINTNIDNKVLFLGYSFIKGDSSGGKILHFVFYWKRIGEFHNPLGFLIEFLDKNQKPKFSKAYNFGYRIYPLESLPFGEVLAEHRYVLVPCDAEDGDYQMRARFIDLRERKILPVLDGIKTDRNARIILGDVPIARDIKR